MFFPFLRYKNFQLCIDPWYDDVVVVMHRPLMWYNFWVSLLFKPFSSHCVFSVGILSHMLMGLEIWVGLSRMSNATFYLSCSSPLTCGFESVIKSLLWLISLGKKHFSGSFTLKGSFWYFSLMSCCLWFHPGFCWLTVTRFFPQAQIQY